MASKFSIYGVGRVAEDINGAETWDIEAYLVEDLPTTSGTIGETENENKEYKDKSGKAYSISTHRSNTVTATWLSFGNYNRATAPSVCKGEYVLLFRYGGEDKFYWIPLFSEFDIRKKETAMFFFSNKTGMVTQEEVQQQGYYFKVDTRNKQVSMHTDDSQDEATTYDVIFDTASGIILIEDGNSNAIQLSSTEGILNFTIDKQITAKVGDQVSVDAGKSVDLKLETFSVTNSQAELIQLLSDILQAIIDMQHTGNLGAPTMIYPSSKSKLEELKAKLDSFIG